MANAFTTLGFILPEVGADTNLWGGHNNQDWQLVDAMLQRFVGTTTTRLLSFDVTGISTTTTRSVIWRDKAGTVALEAVLRSYIAGLTLSNDVGAPNTKLDVAAGVCMDDTNASMLTLAAGVITCTNTGANGLDAGALVASTWYHTFAIGTPGVVTTAYVASIQPSSPIMPATFTLKRRIGSFKTDGSGNILPFVQDGDDVQWLTAPQDINLTVGDSAAHAITLGSIPTGVRVTAHLQPVINNSSASAATAAYFSDLATSDIATAPATFADTPVYASAGQNVSSGGSRVSVKTNTSAQIRYRFSNAPATTTLIVNTLGWTDRRGKDA